MWRLSAPLRLEVPPKLTEAGKGGFTKSKRTENELLLESVAFHSEKGCRSLTNHLTGGKKNGTKGPEGKPRGGEGGIYRIRIFL